MTRLTWLRAVEWCAWPRFISQPLLPILFVFYPVYIVCIVVAIATVLWWPISSRYTSFRLAAVGRTWVMLKWPLSLVMGAHVFLQGRHYFALAVLSAPLIAMLIPVPGSGKTGAVQKRLMREIGFYPDESGHNFRLANAITNAAIRMTDDFLLNAWWEHEKPPQSVRDQVMLECLSYLIRSRTYECFRYIAWQRRFVFTQQLVTYTADLLGNQNNSSKMIRSFEEQSDSNPGYYMTYAAGDFIGEFASRLDAVCDRFAIVQLNALKACADADDLIPLEELRDGFMLQEHLRNKDYL